MLIIVRRKNSFSCGGEKECCAYGRKRADKCHWWIYYCRPRCLSFRKTWPNWTPGWMMSVSSRPFGTNTISVWGGPPCRWKPTCESSAQAPVRESRGTFAPWSTTGSAGAKSFGFPGTSRCPIPALYPRSGSDWMLTAMTTWPS